LKERAFSYLKTLSGKERIMLKMSKVTKSYQVGPTQLDVLTGVDLHIEEGELLAIMGKSGSGKSTLMNIIGLLDQATSGEFVLNNKSISAYNDDELAIARNEMIGFVFQSFYLLPRLNALENVVVPLIYRDLPEKQQYQQGMRVLEKVGMGDRTDHRPNELSGGQRQRVAIARALVGNPRFILADEPTGALDTKVGSEIMQLFLDLNQREGITIVIITHDPGIAKQCKRTVVMQDGKLQKIS
jgi:putative ABC transport system ATP-binding protein